MVVQALSKAAYLFQMRLNSVVEIVNGDRAVARYAAVLALKEEYIVIPSEHHVVVVYVLVRATSGENFF